MTASPSVISEPGARVKMAFSGLVSDPSQLSGAKHWTVVSAVLAKVSLLLSEIDVAVRFNPTYKFLFPRLIPSTFNSEASFKEIDAGMTTV
ncbi:membrane protein [Listeria monocytogenes]|nr:membrane protein [Listeria monocytogenes]